MAAQKKDKPDLTAEKHRQSFDARELRAANQRSALARLATEPALSSGDLVAAAQALTEIASSAIAVARISIWLLTDDGEELKCLDLYEPARPQHSSGLILRASDYPGYFDAVLRESRVYADDTFTDRRTVEFIENYLKPLGITSMLDAGIFAEGKLLGVFCFEHVGEIRHWHIDEESFASTIAALSAQVLENIRRRKVEQALRESQEKYKGLFQNSADAQFVMNTEFVDCNVEACRLLGHKYEELIGHSPLDFSPPLQPDGRKSRVAVRKYIDLALKGRPQTFYWQHQHKDGSLLDTEVRLHRVVVDDHKMLMASVRDISERKQAERIIAHGRDWYRALAEDIPVLVTRISADGRITFVNEASRAFFGRPLKKLVGQGFFNLVPPEYRAEVEEKFALLIPEEPTVTYEHFKQSRLFRWKNRAIFNPDLTLKEYLTVGEDITERHEARNALQYQLQCEQLVAEISSAFVNTRAEKIDEAMNLALKRSGEFFGADRCHLMRFSADQQYIVTPYEWCAEGVSSIQARNNMIPIANTPWWTAQILSKEHVYIPDVDEMPPEAEADKIDFKIEEIKSILTIPVIRGGEVFAFLGLDEVKSKKTWTEQQIALLRTVAEIISETLLKHEAEEALKDSEERYREILATIEEAYYESNLLGNMTFCNGATGRIFGGYSTAEMIGASYKKLYKDPKRVFAAYNRVFLTGEPDKGVVLETIRKDGSIGFAELSITLIRDKSGVVTGFKGIGRDITSRIKYEQRLEYLSLYDQLTGIHNRAYFESELSRLEGSREYPITIISADLDGLKLINDTMGHDAGDRLLCSAATLLKESLRQEDLLARVGGDEFSAILQRTDQQTGEGIVKRIREKVIQFNQENLDLPLGISVGIATAEQGETSLKEVYRQADDSMYRDKLYRSSSNRGKIVQSLLAALAERDYIAEGHARRLEELCRAVGEQVALSSYQLADLALLAQVHDLGKVGIPDRILYKPGPLTDEEWEVMRSHPEKGYRIASASPDLSGVADLILRHHERWDGSGYPLQLQGKDIPIECRILSIVDAFDAMTNQRPYNKLKTAKEAFEEIESNAGSQFDPELVAVFLAVAGEDQQP